MQKQVRTADPTGPDDPSATDAHTAKRGKAAKTSKVAATGKPAKTSKVAATGKPAKTVKGAKPARRSSARSAGGSRAKLAKPVESAKSKSRPRRQVVDAPLPSVLPETADPPAVPLPAGRYVDLVGRGRIFVREVEGPPGAPVLLLLHGWLATSGLNWATAFDVLAPHFRLIAPDQRGHGRGIRDSRAFGLEDCADDAAALLDALEIESAIAVGYSMGGTVAQLLWRRHPEKVAGLVLCATSGEPVTAGPFGRAAFTTTLSALAGTARIGQLATRLPFAVAHGVARPFERQTPPLDPLFALGEISRHDFRMLFEAGAALSRYQANDWIREIDVPSSVLVTTLDTAVMPEGQMLQALSIRDVRTYCIDDGHIAITDPALAEQLRIACLDTAERAGRARKPRQRARRRRRIEGAVEALIGER